VHAVNEAQSAAPVSTKPPPEKLVIKNRSDDPSLLTKWLRGAQFAAGIVFFIGCGAVAIVLERLANLFKSAEGDAGRNPSARPDAPQAQEPPQRIKVPMFPIDNYNQLDAVQVMNRLAGLSNEQIRIVRAHEARLKNREDVLEAIDRHLAETR